MAAISTNQFRIIEALIETKVAEHVAPLEAQVARLTATVEALQRQLQNAGLEKRVASLAAKLALTETELLTSTELDLSGHQLFQEDLSNLVFLLQSCSMACIRLNVDGGLPLSLDELQGSESREAIDLSGADRRSVAGAASKLGAGSAMVVAACISKNAVLKTLNVDGHPLPIDELKGATPSESLDLSDKELGVASAIIIGACIKGNRTLTSLNLAGNGLCGTHLEHGSFGLQMGNYTLEGIAQLCEGLKGSAITWLNLRANDLDPSAKKAVQAAAGADATLLF